jgi:hypothetical protein
MSRVIVYTRADGGISVVHPAASCIKALRVGGYISCFVSENREGLCEWLANFLPPHVTDWMLRTGYLPLPIARAWEIHKFVVDPNWRPDRSDREQIAARWIDALIYGGAEGDDALWLISDKDAAPYSTAHEIIDAAELPDYRHRDLWRRSDNGGPLWVSDTP